MQAIVDEAGQVTKTALMQVLPLGVMRMLLIGDTKQLAPVVKSKAARAAGLEVSLLEHLEALGYPVGAVRRVVQGTRI
jgi:superfamily I DNA and/or RNA helicase